MTERLFEMRFTAAYTDPDNSVETLAVDTLIDGEWQQLALNTGTAGFQIFVYAILTCQHMYFRVNAAEKGLSLASSEGWIRIVTDADWNMQSLDVDMKGVLRSGEPSETDRIYIAERMGLCPVSRNLVTPAQTRTQVEFETA